LLIIHICVLCVQMNICDIERKACCKKDMSHSEGFSNLDRDSEHVKNEKKSHVERESYVKSNAKFGKKIYDDNVDDKLRSKSIFNS